MSTSTSTLSDQCSHLDQIRNVDAQTTGCAECMASGDTWVQLRKCMTCGHVGCCDSSKNKHATQHFHATRHPVMQSFRSGDDWAWCYVDETYLRPVPRIKAA